MVLIADECPREKPPNVRRDRMGVNSATEQKTSQATVAELVKVYNIHKLRAPLRARVYEQDVPLTIYCVLCMRTSNQ